MFDCLKPPQIFKAQERCHCLFSVPTLNTHTHTHQHTSKRASCQSLTTHIDRKKKPRSFNTVSVLSLRGNWRRLSETLLLMLVTSYTHRDTHTTGVHNATRSAVFPKPRRWRTFMSLIIVAFMFDIFPVWRLLSLDKKRQQLKTQGNNKGWYLIAWKYKVSSAWNVSSF